MHSISKSTCSVKTSRNGSRYGHHWAPIETGGQQAHQPHYAVHTPDRASRSRSHPTRPEPPSTGDQTTCLVGLGRSPVSTTRAVALETRQTDVTSSRSDDAAMAAVSVEPVTARGARAGPPVPEPIWAGRSRTAPLNCATPSLLAVLKQSARSSAPPRGGHPPSCRVVCHADIRCLSGFCRAMPLGNFVQTVCGWT